MELQLDRREEFKDQPGVHVLIAGVSYYHHLPGGQGEPAADSFGFQQLTSAALTAALMHEWVIQHRESFAAPLVTVRLLLSPSPSEADALAKYQAPACTRQAFQRAVNRWREDARSNEGNVTLFYFVGHGMRMAGKSSILLLQDFAEPDEGKMTHTAAFDDIFNGMAPRNFEEMAPEDRPEKDTVAQSQYYFVDACRVTPADFDPFRDEKPPLIWSDGVKKSGRDERSAPVFYAAVSEAEAEAYQNRQTVFSEVLVLCFAQTAARVVEIEGNDRWVVNVHSLSDALQSALMEKKERLGIPISFQPGGIFRNTQIIRLDRPPRMRITIFVDPEGVPPDLEFQVRDRHDEPLPHLPNRALIPVPYPLEIEAGLYFFQTTLVHPPQPLYRDSYRDICNVDVAAKTWRAKMQK